MQQENYGIIVITETGHCVMTHNWRDAVDGCKLFRRDRQGRRSSGIALCFRECWDSLEFNCDASRVLMGEKQR